MKTILATGAASIILLSLSQAQTTPETSAQPVAEAPKKLDDASIKKYASYGFGYQTGRQFAGQAKQYGLNSNDIDVTILAKAFLTGFQENEPEYSDQDLSTAMQQLGDKLQARQEKVAEENLAKGKAFLAENAKRKGVTTTKSGLQYEILKKGGAEVYKAAEGEPQFKVNYKGTLIDGTVFDASPEGQPIPMGLQVIPGFKEALTTMPVGAKWKLFIPSELAYGPQGAGGKIAPNSPLIFELELVEITQEKPQSITTPPIPVPAAPAEKK